MKDLKKNFATLLISLLFINVANSQIDTLMVFSKTMNKNIPNLVITPENDAIQNEKKPVLYLLHGVGGTYTDWLSKVPSIKKYANDFNIIIVCPDGGNSSWYFDSPIDNTMKYETYISKELIEIIDKKYNTVPDRKGRAIAGLSMGGHGALYLAFKHQNIWGACGSMSGGVDIRPFHNNWDISMRLGPLADNIETWEENTVINLVYLLKGNLKIIFDCGYDDFFYQVNKELHQKLLENGVSHDYIERPGGHNWDYWSNAIKYQLVYFNDYFGG
jgi:S-formylglutathione hydrolase FrmB